MAKIIYGSTKEARAYNSTTPTIMVGLCDRAPEPALIPKEAALNSDVEEYHKVPFKVLHPTGPEGSFADIDEQAKKTGEYLKSIISSPEKTDFDIFIHCEYGEIRSHMVALGMYFGFSGDRDLFECLKGVLHTSDRRTSCTQGQRTSSWIGCITQRD